MQRKRILDDIVLHVKRKKELKSMVKNSVLKWVEELKGELNPLKVQNKFPTPDDVYEITLGADCIKFTFENFLSSYTNNEYSGEFDPIELTQEEVDNIVGIMICTRTRLDRV